VPGTAIQLPIRCDEEGNYYVRFFHGSRATKEPIYKIDKNGVQRAVFAITSTPDFDASGTAGVDFAVGKNGDVFQIAIAEKSNYVVHFSKEGVLQSAVKIDKEFTPLRIAVFDSGKLLMSGLDLETAEKPNPHSLYTGVFDGSGKLLKEIVLAEDKKYQEAADRGDAEFIGPGQIGGGNFAIERGNVTRASDGNIYLVRWTIPAKVYAISSDGEVTRSFEVEPELQHKKPGGVYEHSGRLAIQFEGDREDPSSVIKVVGLDGEDYATYDSSGLGIAFVGYSERERFAFFTVEGKDLK
jgi:hypothetical protein